MEIIEIDVGIRRIKVVIGGFPHVGGSDLRVFMFFNIWQVGGGCSFNSFR